MTNIEKYNNAFVEVFGVTEEVLNDSFSKENVDIDLLKCKKDYKKC